MLPVGLSPAIRLRAQGVGGGPAPGYYWASGYQATTITTATTKFNDVGAGDQTTYEEVTGGVGVLIGISALVVVAAPTAYTNITFKAWCTDSINFEVARWTGSAWAIDWYNGVGATPALAGGGEWVSVSRNVLNTFSTSQIRVTFNTQGSGIASVARIGDIRLT